MTARKPAKKPTTPPPFHVAQLAHVLDAPKLAMALQVPPDAEVDCARLAQHLIEQPELIARPEWAKIIVRILRTYVADHPPRNPNSAEMAFLVDHLVLTGRSLAEARRLVAQLTGKTPTAVKKAHVRHGAKRKA